jgi:uncharacterized cupin superfamily protein
MRLVPGFLERWPILNDRPAGAEAPRGSVAAASVRCARWYGRTVRRVNISAPGFEYDADDPEGFRSGMFRFGKLIGASRLGATVYELPPGQSICPYHYEYGEEEWLLVLEGRPTLRHPDGAEMLDPWDVVCFPSGPEGAHAVRNDTDADVRVLMFSTVSHPAASVYPDSDKIAIWTGNAEDNLIVRRASGVDYWVGETG